MWKKLISLNLAILLLFGMLPLNTEAAEQEESLTRAEFCQFVADALKVDLTPYQDMESPFSDVQKGDPNYAAILYCTSEGFVSGTSQTTFLPNHGITRAQAATILVRSLGLESYFQEPSSIPDDLNPGSWYYQPCLTALTMRLMSVADDGNFYPNKNVTLSDIDQEVLNQLLPKPMYYDGKAIVEVDYGEESLELEYSRFTDANGNSLGLDSSWQASHRGSGLHLDWNYSGTKACLWSNQVSSGDTGTITVTNGKASYFIKTEIIWPELAFYTSENITEQSFLCIAGKYNFNYNYLLGRDVYILPGKENWQCTSVTANGANTDKFTASVFGRGVKLSVNSDVTGAFDTGIQVSYIADGSTTVQKDLVIQFTDEHFLGDNSGWWDYAPGEDSQWELYIGSKRIKKEDGFSLRLSGIPGKAEWSSDNGGWARVWVSRNAEFGSRGQLIATKDGISFTREIHIDLPYLGFYSTKERTPKSFLGSCGSAFVDIEKNPALKTVYLLSASGSIECDRVVFFNTETPPFDVEIPEGKKYIAFTLRDGLNSAYAQFEAYGSNGDLVDGGTLTFAKASALRTGDGDMRIFAQAGEYLQSFWGITCTDTGEIVDGSFKLGVEGNIGKVTIDEYGNLNLEVKTAKPGEGRITAEKNGIVYSIPVTVELPEYGFYKAPQATVENYVGPTINYKQNPEQQTVYYLPAPWNTDFDSFASVEVNEYYAKNIGVTIEGNGKYLKIINKAGSSDIYGFFSTEIALQGNSSHRQWRDIQFTDGKTLTRTEICYLGEKNQFSLEKWDGTLIDDSYTVTLKAKTGKTTALPWLDSQTLLWDTSDMDGSAVGSYTLIAAKGSESFTCDAWLNVRDFSTYSQIASYSPAADVNLLKDEYFLHNFDKPTDYSKGRRTVYIYGYEVSGDLTLFQEPVSCDNPKIKVSLADNNRALQVTLDSSVTGEEKGNIQVKYTEGTRETYVKEKTIPVSFINGTGNAPTSGATGDAQWEVENGTLTISGEGEMGAHSAALEWEKVKDKVTEVKVEEGVTNIASGAFQDFANLTKVTLPETVTSIDENAFDRCEKLTEVYIPAAVGNIAETAFEGCKDISIKGAAGDTYAETFAMMQDIPYASESGLAAQNGELNVDIGKVVTADKRVAVAAVVENGTGAATDGNVVAAVYHNQKMITCVKLEKAADAEKKERVVLQLPYKMRSIDPKDLDIQILYLGQNDTAPLTASAKGGTENAITAR